ncbi:hypothetical protein [Microbacterium sp. GXS0129]|uniref:hypothetical protein n=1 Tax=Microbacterium sp. GXS0129 TaxID=3377836 RepID=UPI00383A9B9F
MVGVTAASVLVSGVLAYLAYRNGVKATMIAEEAAARDADQRTRESNRLAREERSTVALAMMRAVAAADQMVRVRDEDTATYALTLSDVETEMNIRRAEALAHVDLYAIAPEDDELRVWLESTLDRLTELPTDGMDRLERLSFVYDARRGIALWNQRAVTSGQLMVGELPPEFPERG